MKIWAVIKAEINNSTPAERILWILSILITVSLITWYVFYVIKNVAA